MKHILILVIIALVSTSTVAQKKEISQEQKAQIENQLKVYEDKLDLTEEQKPKFQEIIKKYGKQMMALKDSDKGRLSKYKELKSISKNRNKEIKPLLSNEQYKIYEDLQEEIQQKIRDKNRGKR